MNKEDKMKIEDGKVKSGSRHQQGELKTLAIIRYSIVIVTV